MSDLLDVEKITQVRKSPVLTYNASVFQPYQSAERVIRPYKVGLYNKAINYMYKSVQYTRLACTSNL